MPLCSSTSLQNKLAANLSSSSIPFRKVARLRCSKIWLVATLSQSSSRTHYQNYKSACTAVALKVQSSSRRIPPFKKPKLKCNQCHYTHLKLPKSLTKHPSLNSSKRNLPRTHLNSSKFKSMMCERMRWIEDRNRIKTSCNRWHRRRNKRCKLSAILNLLLTQQLIRCVW
jgi:hypothetical protein